jgi:hypothetical protein
LQDPTQEGCASAMDSAGNACEYCSVAGVANVCLTEEKLTWAVPLEFPVKKKSNDKTRTLLLL